MQFTQFTQSIQFRIKITSLAVALLFLLPPMARSQSFNAPILIPAILDTSSPTPTCSSTVLASTFPAAAYPGGIELVTYTAGATPVWCRSNGMSWVAVAGNGSGLTSIASKDLLANITGSPAIPTGNTLTAILDSVFGTTRGSVLYRGVSAWSALAPGVSGYFFETQGSGADPIWGSSPSSVTWELSGSTIATGSTYNVIPGTGVSLPCSNVGGVFTCTPALDTAYGATNLSVTQATNTAVTATGGGTGILVAPLGTGGFAGYTSGQYFTVQISDANNCGCASGGDNINIQGVGPVPLKKISAGSVIAIAAGDMLRNIPYIIRYAGALGTPAFIVSIQ